ncbi:MAG: hypothetical protein AAFQ23_10920, partial [Cyanobacteria bacterium J06623_1]
GAAAYKKDIKNLDCSILDTGHFVLEEEGEFAIAKMRSFLASIAYQQLSMSKSAREKTCQK